MGPISAISSFFKGYVDFNGRARRSEYAWILILHTAMTILMSFIVIGANGGSTELSGMAAILSVLFGLIWLGTVLPWISLMVRRFHDMGYSAWLVALFFGLWFIPPLGALGSIIQLFWLLLGGGSAGMNQYGIDPRFSHGPEFG